MEKEAITISLYAEKGFHDVLKKLAEQENRTMSNFILTRLLESCKPSQVKESGTTYVKGHDLKSMV